ncbi:hypothetical protein [Frigoriglobus tundricola]|uniref:hypothetical protein n=1 Tax=Frigoriglobus tundricola TaxID=2774151 RepID=UPI00148EC43D|nr:hypothetical protein [Frigoriglobus tundricola]
MPGVGLGFDPQVGRAPGEAVAHERGVPVQVEEDVPRVPDPAEHQRVEDVERDHPGGRQRTVEGVP